jgi:hypothetical protein
VAAPPGDVRLLVELDKCVADLDGLDLPSEIVETYAAATPNESLSEST